MRVLHTVSHLKPIQVAYQLKNRFTKPSLLPEYYKDFRVAETKLHFSPLPKIGTVLKVLDNEYQFTFLNQDKTFSSKIDWADEGYGKLWNYNLQYVDFLRQEDVSEEIKLTLLSDLYSALEQGALKLEPYPVSLRIMNVIRFLSQQESSDEFLQKRVFGEVNYLSKHLEYHLLGNHLLENGFALLMGGHFFKNPVWITLAEKLLKKELEEQILDDGAHFELSPMYHQIILFRILEVLDYLPSENPCYGIFHTVAKRMINWLKSISFDNGDIPHFNDSIDGIAFTTKQLIGLAVKLKISPDLKTPLKSSGYRKLKTNNLELVADVHGISPDYQPGHAHADSLSFVLYAFGQPFVVDMGISTYQIGAKRSLERSTMAHNTVTIDNQNTAEVWSGFRVGKRPKVTLLASTVNNIKAYLSFDKFEHFRSFSLVSNTLIIEDKIKSDKIAVSRLYLHPKVEVNLIDSGKIEFSNGSTLLISNEVEVMVNDYEYNTGYNCQVPAKCLEVKFIGECSIKFLEKK
ncbi:Heparinase II/III [Cyclobacterium amurskyense]|uniref:Heparinase II/III n=1 Tax=Cyclobacterium amurskyense TaxID=320787 RepID=A0A0H4PDW4_9BACT|nr:Heparinase II/III [Cyclobacterium amurskyense]